MSMSSPKRACTAPCTARARGGKRRAAVNPGPEADRVLLAHMRDCLERILEYTNADRARFDASRLVQDAVIRNLQTLAESSQRLSSEIKDTEPQIPWRELAGFRNVIVQGYLGVDLGMFHAMSPDLSRSATPKHSHDGNVKSALETGKPRARWSPSYSPTDGSCHEHHSEVPSEHGSQGKPIIRVNATKHVRQPTLLTEVGLLQFIPWRRHGRHRTEPPDHATLRSLP